jgi:hypothetical protein
MSLFGWFSKQFVHKKPPTPPSPPALRTVAMVITSTTGAPLPNARILTSPDFHFPPSNGDGYTSAVMPAAQSAVSVQVDLDGYDTYTSTVSLPAGNYQFNIPLTSNRPAHVDPSTFDKRELMRIRGAMWTVRGPWRYGPRPGQPDNITALEFIYSYGDPMTPFVLNDEQQNMLATYKALGYTHVAFGPPCAASYHGQYPDTNFITSPEMFDVWLDWLQMFYDHGLIPVVFLHKDGASFEESFALYDHLIRNNPKAQRLIRLVVPTGWEPAKYEWSSYTWMKFCKWAREVLPDACVLIHTVSDVDAPVGTDTNGDDNGRPNAEGWARVAPYIHGWLVQSSAFEDPDSHGDPNNPQNTNFDNWAGLFDKNKRGSYWDRFHNGYGGWPRFSAWGNEPLYIFAAEFCSYWAYNGNRPYAEGVKWGDRALSVGADGVLDSCSQDVPRTR